MHSYDLAQALFAEQSPIPAKTVKVPRLKKEVVAVPAEVAEPEALPEEEATVEAMAECVGLKRTRFTHYCKKLKNTTPTHYLNHLRVEKAKKFLRDRPDLNLTDIGLECGFANGQYFSTVFKRISGIAPIEYRRKHAEPQ